MPRETKKQLREKAELQQRRDDVIATIKESASVAEMTAATTTIKILNPCIGCDGDRVQRNLATGIKVLCPVCNGTGSMPLVPGVPIMPNWPYPPAPYLWPYQSPYPGDSGMQPYRPLPNQIVD